MAKFEESELADLFSAGAMEEVNGLRLRSISTGLADKEL